MAPYASLSQKVKQKPGATPPPQRHRRVNSMPERWKADKHAHCVTNKATTIVTYPRRRHGFSDRRPRGGADQGTISFFLGPVFRNEDFEALAQMMKSASSYYANRPRGRWMNSGPICGVGDWRWVAGIHLNNASPAHSFPCLQRDVPLTGESLAGWERIPKRLLPYKEPRLRRRHSRRSRGSFGSRFSVAGARPRATTSGSRKRRIGKRGTGKRGTKIWLEFYCPTRSIRQPAPSTRGSKYRTVRELLPGDEDLEG